MNTSLSKKSKHLSISYSFTKSSSFSQCPNISIKKRRHTSSYKELYLNRINFVSTQTPTSKPKGLDYLYATIYKSNTAKLKQSEYPFTTNINNIINSNMHTNRVIDRYRSSNDVHTKLKDLKKEMMSVNKFNSGNCSRGRFNNNIYNGMKGIIYSKASTNNGSSAKRLFKDGECSSSNKYKGEMILEGLGVDKSFERRMNGDEEGEDMLYSDIKVNNINDNNNDDTNFLITDRQEKSVLKGTLVDHNEKGDYEDMNEIKNQLDNAIAKSVHNKVTCNNNINNVDNDIDNDNEIDKQHEIIITSQTDINVNNCNCNSNCNVIFKSDSFNYGINVYNNIQQDNNPYTMNINSTSTNSHSKQTQNIIQCNNNNNNNSATSLDIVKSAKHLHEHRYSNDDNEQEHEQMCCSSSQREREATPTYEDNKAKCHEMYNNHEIKEEDEEYDESVGVSVLKQVKKRTQYNSGSNSSSHNECKLVIEEIQNQKNKLLNMKQTNVNSDYERLQKIKTLLHKTTHAPIAAITNTNHAVTSLNKSPLTITNTSLTIYNNNIKSLITHHNHNHKQPLSLSTPNTYLTLSNEHTFNILSTPKIYSPNNINTIHISQPLPPSSSPLQQQPHLQPQFNTNELHSEIDTFLNNIKLRNKSKETHLTSLKLQKAQELQQLKTKQQLLSKQKQHLTHFHKEPPTYTTINNNNHRITTNTNTNNNNVISPPNHHHQQETTTTTLSSVKKNTNTYTSIFNTLLEDERYNTLRNNMSKRCVKENNNKYGETFNQEVEKENDLFLKKVKEDIRDIKSKRKVKEELNAFVYGNTWGSKYVNAVGKRNNCVMPVNSIDGGGDRRDIGFFMSYMNNNNNGSSSSNNNYIFKK